MKTIVTIIIACLSTIGLSGQEDLSLKIIEGSDKPNSDSEHLYLLEATNNTKAEISFNILVANKPCNDSKLAQTELSQEVLNLHKSNRIDKMVVMPGDSLKFYVKLSRPADAKLNTWNCTEVKAVSRKGSLISNLITIESLIPNPNDSN